MIGRRSLKGQDHGPRCGLFGKELALADKFGTAGERGQSIPRVFARIERLAPARLVNQTGYQLALLPGIVPVDLFNGVGRCPPVVAHVMGGGQGEAQKTGQGTDLARPSGAGRGDSFARTSGGWAAGCP